MANPPSGHRVVAEWPPKQCPCSEPLFNVRCHFNCGKCRRFLKSTKCRHAQCECGGAYYDCLGQDPFGVMSQCECGGTQKHIKRTLYYSPEDANPPQPVSQPPQPVPLPPNLASKATQTVPLASKATQPVPQPRNVVWTLLYKSEDNGCPPGCRCGRF